MTAPLLVEGVEHEAQVFVASMGVSGRLYAEATLTQKIEDWCASHVRCFEDMGWAPQLVVPDNIKPAVTQPSRYEPVLNETYADLLEHYGVQGLPARVRRPRDKGLLRQVLACQCTCSGARSAHRPRMKRESLPFRPSGLGFPSQSRAGQMSTLGPKSHLSGGRAPIAQHQNFYGARS